jgi:hypothetical protein
MNPGSEASGGAAPSPPAAARPAPADGLPPPGVIDGGTALALRSGIAAAELRRLGYTGVYDFQTLASWPGEVAVARR